MSKNETNKIDNESNMDKTCTLVPKKDIIVGDSGTEGTITDATGNSEDAK
jgi:hypothetical protein